LYTQDILNKSFQMYILNPNILDKNQNYKFNLN